ncbi:hypothetical protein ACFL03_16055 [Thermodesulfobacteriota bacterium]
MAYFENRVKNELAASDFAHADETGINIGGKKHWLHCTSNDAGHFIVPMIKGEQMPLTIWAYCPDSKGYCAITTESHTIKWIVRTPCVTPII